MQSPMISSPVKQTNEIDWIAPLKHHIRAAYSDDPERYAEECAVLNRLRQDMRGAGKDSATGRDLLYRYYGQLELLDLRFPVDENHIKISFTWFDAFTHKPTTQFSLAYEKASIIFNISAVLSCHAAQQNRHEIAGLKMAYHSFQASAGMYTYINENFLHAPSTDLSRETVKTLIHVMLAQAQEVLIERQILDQKKPGIVAKLAAQAAYLYSLAVEGVQENVSQAIFERVWLLLTQIKQHHMSSMAEYYQAIADYEASSYGQAISRLSAAQRYSKEAARLANAMPASMPSNSNLGSDTGTILSDTIKKHLSAIQEKLAEYTRDNDMIFHQPVPAEASLPSIPKMVAAKAISVADLYQSLEIQKIIGPDIFQRIVPMSVTESASLYDEEKAKLFRAEAERCETADDELVTSLDYLKLPGSLNILKGGLDENSIGVDEEFQDWCAELAGHSPFGPTFDQLRDDKQNILTALDGSLKQLDMEESVCEKMRSKYGAEWTQQPSSRLNATLRTDARSYRSAVDEASTSDAQLYSTFRQHESDFDEMRSAGETDEADVLYQRAMIKTGAKKRGSSGPNVQNEGNLLDDDFADQSQESVQQIIERVEELMRKLQLVKKERTQVLRDLKEKIHNDDISNVLILNRKAITNQEAQLFKQELEKFRPHQNRILQAVHKQSSLMKEMTRTYSGLLQDKRVRAEQNRYESFSRQRNTVLARYKKIYHAYKDLRQGMERANKFYAEMKDSVESLKHNVESFVENRRSEGAALLSAIEERKGIGADREQARLKDLMERMSISPATHHSASPPPDQRAQQSGYGQFQPGLAQQQQQPPLYNPARSPPITAGYGPPHQSGGAGYQYTPTNGHARRNSYQQHREAYNPNTYSAPAQQQFFPSHLSGGSSSQPSTTTYAPQPTHRSTMPPGWQPPPPPPGPPPSQDYSAISAMDAQQQPYPSGPGGYASSASRAQSQQGAAVDPWAGLSSWK